MATYNDLKEKIKNVVCKADWDRVEEIIDNHSEEAVYDINLLLNDIRSDIEQHTYGFPTITGNCYRRGFYNGLVLSKYILTGELDYFYNRNGVLTKIGEVDYFYNHKKEIKNECDS